MHVSVHVCVCPYHRLDGYLRRDFQAKFHGQCQRWLSGESLFHPDLAGLASFISSLRLIPISERPVEAQHAKTHKRGAGRHNHTEHYVSYGLRVPELSQDLEASPSLLPRLAFCCRAASNAK
eukprot:1627129-Alexandrium_andersonii.AAC.1